MSLGDTRAIIVSVDFADILALTLPINVKHFGSVLVVTHPRDQATIDVAVQNRCEVFMTDAFYGTAYFNKYRAVEIGLDYMGRNGWMCVMDADIVLPYPMNAWSKRAGCLYVPRRRMLDAIPREVPEVRKWRQLKYRMPNEPFDGYCQIFSAEDRVLGPAPWYATNWKSCSGPDFSFREKWATANQVRPPFDCLHIGEPLKNWCGRVTSFADGRIPPEAAQRMDWMKIIMRDRQKRRGMDKYEMEILGEDVCSNPVSVFRD